MSKQAYGSKIVHADGVISFLHTSGLTTPLSTLAIRCNYRLDQICKILDISPRHLRRLFDRCLGICPKQWIISERMVYARTLLRGGMSIRETSEILGFSAQKEFHREFRNHYEMAPSHFRAQHTEQVMEKLGWSN